MDRIVAVHVNADGDFEFDFIFDGGDGVTGSTFVVVPRQDPPLSLEDAKALALPMASAKKAAWLVAIGSADVIGNVSL